MRKFNISILLIIIMVTCSACSSKNASNQSNAYDKAMEQLDQQFQVQEGTNQKEESNYGQTEENLETKVGTLTIEGSFFVDIYLEYIEKQIELYTAKNPGVTIILENDSDYAGYNDRLQVELMAGQAKDVILIPDKLNPNVISAAYFADLYPLMEQDITFQKDEYFMNIIDSYAKDGQLFALITGFTPHNLYMMRNDVMGSVTEDFEANESLSYNDLIRFYFNVMSNEEITKEWYFSKNFTPMEVMQNNFDVLIDFERKQAKFTDPEFIDLMEQAKNIVPINTNFVSYTSDGLKQTYTFSTTEDFQDVITQTNTFLFKDSYTAIYESYFPQQERVLTYPKLVSTAGGNYYFADDTKFAISKNCENPELAWDFLKFILSEKEPPEMEDDLPVNYIYGLGDVYAVYGPSFPVNRNSYVHYLDFFFRKTLCFAPEELVDDETQTQRMDYINETTQKLIEVAERLNLPMTYYDELYMTRTTGMVWDDMYLYLTNKQSVEQTMKNIENKVNLWLNE